ncbi:MAG: hypothetical protein WCB04_01805 [Mycobacteriales bacterium]
MGRPRLDAIDAERKGEAHPDTQADAVGEGDSESERAARVESIDTQLASETDPAIREALLSELGPLLGKIGEGTYANSARITNVRNNFALGSYYDIVNVRDVKGK